MKKSSQGVRLLCVPAGWESYLSGEFYEIHKELESRGWTRCIIDDTNDQELLTAIDNADVVLLWEGYEFLERNAGMLCSESSKKLSPRPKRLFFCDDVHYFTAHRREQRSRAFHWADVILATYPDKLSLWYPDVAPEKCVWTPHAAASYFFDLDDTATKSDRILLSGSRTWPYPFRQFCALKLDSSVCDVLEHPGYPGYPGDPKNRGIADKDALLRIGRERYADVLANYAAMLICGSIFGYLVAKVFEGMAAGCLTVCDRSTLGNRLDALGFKEGEHYIGTEFKTVIEDCNSVKEMLSNDIERWRSITVSASSLVREKHCTAVRAAEIDSIYIGFGA